MHIEEASKYAPMSLVLTPFSNNYKNLSQCVASYNELSCVTRLVLFHFPVTISLILKDKNTKP